MQVFSISSPGKVLWGLGKHFAEVMSDNNQRTSAYYRKLTNLPIRLKFLNVKEKGRYNALIFLVQVIRTVMIVKNQSLKTYNLNQFDATQFV